MQNFLILQELQTEFLKFKINFAKISYKEFLIKKTECTSFLRFLSNLVVTSRVQNLQIYFLNDFTPRFRPIVVYNVYQDWCTWHATWVPQNIHVTRTKTELHCMTHLRRSDVHSVFFIRNSL